jgi:hypothetical protein
MKYKRIKSKKELLEEVALIKKLIECDTTEAWLIALTLMQDLAENQLPGHYEIEFSSLFEGIEP